MHYHMLGVNIGSLRVYKNSASGNSVVFSVDGNRGDQWYSAEYSLTGPEQFQVMMSKSTIFSRVMITLQGSFLRWRIKPIERLLIYWCFTKHQSVKWVINELFSFCICVVERVTQISIPITYSKTDTTLGSFDIQMKASLSTPKRNLDLIGLLPRPVSY